MQVLISKYALLILLSVVTNVAFAQTEAPAKSTVFLPPQMAVVCPTQVKAVIPSEALDYSIGGVVETTALIANGAVKEVTIESGPPVYYEAVRKAMLQYKCVDSPESIRVRQRFRFDFTEHITSECHQIAPIMPRSAIDKGIQGIVKAQIYFVEGKAMEVNILSGPSVYRNPVREAVLQYKCPKSFDQVVATQEFKFRIGDSPSVPSYSIRQYLRGEDTQESNVVARASLPLDKTYQELSAPQKAQLRGAYVDMKMEDEPPFPTNGLGELQNIILKGAEKMGVSGWVLLFLSVDGNGSVATAQIVQAPNEEFGKFAAQVGMLTSFKPAVCGGQPCIMDFPLIFKIVRTYK
jgi:hypothetical protein